MISLITEKHIHKYTHSSTSTNGAPNSPGVKGGILYFITLERKNCISLLTIQANKEMHNNNLIFVNEMMHNFTLKKFDKQQLTLHERIL